MSWWTDRQNSDPFVKKRKKEGLISRAYFKIQEINERFELIKKDDRILDLGAAPGGWCQYFIKFSKNIVAVDLLDNFQVKGVHFIVGDIQNDEIMNPLGTFDIVVSDIAPNMSGNKFVDQCKIIELCEKVFEIAKKKLSKNGHLVMKSFDGLDFDSLIKTIKPYFGKLHVFKPLSSRVESKEKYLVFKWFK